MIQNLKNKNQYDEFIYRIQQSKMKELWNNKDDYIWEMKKRGVFNNPELIVLSKLLIKTSLTRNENKLIKRLLKRPSKPIKIIDGKIQLTEMGRDLAKGFLSALLYSNWRCFK